MSKMMPCMVQHPRYECQAVDEIEGFLSDEDKWFGEKWGGHER